MTERSFFDIYTPRNIWLEMVFRFKKLVRSRADRPARPATAKAYDPGHARSVGQFYNQNHEHFLEEYGQVIQAFRTKDVNGLLDYQRHSMGLREGLRLLDAGCGVAAPAVYFASQIKLNIDAVTISQKQYEAALGNVAEAGVGSRVKIVCGDYHRLPDLLPPGTYDGVYFLESFGHSRDKKHLLDVCWTMLKPGGFLYIKDLFRKVPLAPEHTAVIDREIRKIDTAYHYEVANLNDVLDWIRGKGFMLEFLKSIALKPEDFENLDISNIFQELTGIATIDNWAEYVFPVDFFEIKCIKPDFDLSERPDRHFLQNISQQSHE